MDNTNVKQEPSWWQTHRPGTRRLVQLYSALLYNAHLKGFIEGEIYQGNTKAVCVPGFNCYSCPGAVGACPLGSIQNALASSGHRAGWYVLGILMLYGVILGRTICGWICPLGLVQELLHKIPTPKILKSCITRALSWLKYVILGVFVVAIPLWYGVAYDIPLPGFCKYICPAGTFEGAMGLLPANPSYLDMLGILFTRKFVIMLIIAAACVFCYRSFCRFLCPLGAIYGLFNRFNVIGVKVDANRCNHCGNCVRSCGMDVRRVGDHECINCGKCMSVCRQGAISIKAGKFTLKAPDMGCAGDGPDAGTKRRNFGRIAWGIALAVLCFALLWYNVLDPEIRKKNEAQEAGSAGQTQEAVQAVTEDGGADPSGRDEAGAEAAASTESEGAQDGISSQTEEEDTAVEAGTKKDSAEDAGGEKPAADAASYVSTAPVGNEVGQQLADFTAQCYDGSTFHLADTRGKVTFINLWATYCTPCVHELPYFSDLMKEHEGDVAILAVHSSLVAKDDPKEFIRDKGYLMPFTTDTPDKEIFDIIGGSSALPQTVVLNRKGEVIYNKVQSVTPEVLEALYEEAGKE